MSFFFSLLDLLDCTLAEFFVSLAQYRLEREEWLQLTEINSIRIHKHTKTMQRIFQVGIIISYYYTFEPPITKNEAPTSDKYPSLLGANCTGAFGPKIPQFFLGCSEPVYF